MIKGARKQMIVLRTGDSKYFDEAYFVLRKNVPPHATGRDDILNEANRILSETTAKPRTAKRAPWLFWGIFFAGILCGALCTAVTICLIVF